MNESTVYEIQGALAYELRVAAVHKSQSKLPSFTYDEQQAEINKMSEANRPKAKYRIGTVCVTEWENEGKEGEKYATYSVQVSRYDKETKQFVPAKTLSYAQLQNLQTCVRKACMARVSDR